MENLRKGLLDNNECVNWLATDCVVIRSQPPPACVRSTQTCPKPHKISVGWRDLTVWLGLWISVCSWIVTSVTVWGFPDMCMGLRIAWWASSTNHTITILHQNSWTAELEVWCQKTQRPLDQLPPIEPSANQMLQVPLMFSLLWGYIIRGRKGINYKRVSKNMNVVFAEAVHKTPSKWLSVAMRTDTLLAQLRFASDAVTNVSLGREVGVQWLLSLWPNKTSHTISPRQIKPT